MEGNINFLVTKLTYTIYITIIFTDFPDPHRFGGCTVSLDPTTGSRFAVLATTY